MDWRSSHFCEDFRRGDGGTLESIYWAYVDGVEHILTVGFVGRNGRFGIPGVGDPDRRADLIQEVFLKAFSESARQRFDVRLEYPPYLWAITRNVLADHHRLTRRETATSRRVFDDDLQLAEEPSEPEWIAPALVEIVERYVAALVPPLADVHQMRFVRGRSQREVALELGMSRQNVRTLEGGLKEGLLRELQAAWRSQPMVRVALDGNANVLRVAEARSK